MMMLVAKIVVGIKEEGQQPGQKRKVDTDVGTDGPNKRMTTSADNVNRMVRAMRHTCKTDGSHVVGSGCRETYSEQCGQC